MMLSVLFLLTSLRHDIALDRLVIDIAVAGRVTELAEPSAGRVTSHEKIAPGLAPLLAFRYYEGEQRHRFSNSELILDDAGH